MAHQTAHVLQDIVQSQNMNRRLVTFYSGNMTGLLTPTARPQVINRHFAQKRPVGVLRLGKHLLKKN